MPTWLAIAIPSVVAVAAIMLWVLDYFKKAHELQKLRLEIEKLKRESERSEREDEFRGSGLYKPTAEEVDRLVRRLPGSDFPRWSRRPSASYSYSAGSNGCLIVLAAIVAMLVLGSVIRWVIHLLS